MKFYAHKYKQLDLGLLRSSLDELDKTNRWVALGDLLPWTPLMSWTRQTDGWLSVTFFHGRNLRRNTTQGWTIRRKVQGTSLHA